MQDYIPGLLQTSFAKDYFEKHPDWYKDQIRELTQAPDATVYDNMEIYKYRFEHDSDYLEAEIDRYGWGICGFEKQLEGKKFSIKTRMKSHKIYIGIPNALTIRIQNENGKDMDFELAIEPFEGLEWKEDFPKTVKLKNNEVFEITREFIINRQATTFKGNNRSCESIKTSIRHSNQLIELITSGKIQQAVNLRAINENGYSFIPINKENRLALDLLNNTEIQLTGEINIEVPELGVKNQIVKYKIDPLDIIGIEIPLYVPEDFKEDKIVVKADVSFESNNKKEIMPTFDYPLLFCKTNFVELLEFEQNKTIILATDKVAIKVFLEGGNILIYKKHNQGVTPIRHQAGPPFGFSLDTTVLHDYEIKKEGMFTTLILTSNSNQIPGLMIKKYLKVAPGLEEVEFWAEYSNTLENTPIYVGARTITSSGGISISPLGATSKSFTPIYNQIIESETFAEFITSPMVSEDVKDWQESWTATIGLLNNDITAWIWKLDNIDKIKVSHGSLSRLDSITKEIKQKDVFIPVHLWCCFGLNSIQDVRNRWNKLVGNKNISYFEDIFGPEVTRFIDAKILEDQTIIKGEKSKKTIEIIIKTNYPLTGTLSFNTPKDWNAKFIEKEQLLESINIPKFEANKPIKIPFEIYVPENWKTQIENIQLCYNSEFNFIFDLPMIITSNKEITIKESLIENKKVYELSNGSITFAVPRDIGGNLIRLKDSKGRNFLVDNFPEVKPRLLITHNIGGMQPVFLHTQSNDPFHKPETTTTEIVKDGLWQGIKSSWVIQNDKEFLKGLNVETTYLTLPESDIIKCEITLNNKSNRKLPFICSQFIDLMLDGSRENNIVEVKRNQKIWSRNPIKQQFIMNTTSNEPYFRIKKGKQSFASVIPEGYNGSNAIFDLVMMVVNWILSITHLDPKSKTTLVFGFLINQPREKMEELRKALRKKN